MTNNHILPYQDIINRDDFRNYFMTAEDQVRKSHFTCELPCMVAIQLGVLLSVGQGSLQGKRILDIGCGSEKSSDGLRVRYTPDLCRYLHSQGIDVTGVDFKDNSKEPFRAYRIDVTKKNCFDALASQTFDIVHSRGLIDSPSLIRPERFIEHLTHEVSKVVKPEGVFVYGEIYEAPRSR
jgi:2-polyprenyl-3-methyl-5-hydroxy-6-metoxy-1,4-benzoquinol methylase